MPGVRTWQTCGDRRGITTTDADVRWRTSRSDSRFTPKTAISDQPGGLVQGTFLGTVQRYNCQVAADNDDCGLSPICLSAQDVNNSRPMPQIALARMTIRVFAHPHQMTTPIKVTVPDLPAVVVLRPLDASIQNQRFDYQVHRRKATGHGRIHVQDRMEGTSIKRLNRILRAMNPTIQARLQT